jgi:hypothetical protein
MHGARWVSFSGSPRWYSYAIIRRQAILLEITDAQYLNDYRVKLTFNDEYGELARAYNRESNFDFYHLRGRSLCQTALLFCLQHGTLFGATIAEKRGTDYVCSRI